MADAHEGQRQDVTAIPAQLDTLGDNSIEALEHGPLYLFLRDCFTFIRMIRLFPNVFFPFKTNNPHDEFYLRGMNLIGLAVLFVVTLLEAVGLVLAIPAFLLLSGFWGIVLLIIGIILIELAFAFLQGPSTVLSEPNSNAETFPSERWIFLNGTCVTGHMLQQNVNLLSKTFRRPVFAVHNRTLGLVGDILECIVQRAFGFYTQDTRLAYEYVKSYCSNSEVTKVVFIGHSQGGIMVSQILDQLYTDLPRDCIAKLEVYTFANAALHFNNPLRRLADPIAFTNTAASAGTSTPADASSQERVIRYIEHYANSEDLVPRWGVLYSLENILNNRFCGQVFIHEHRTGHMLNQHYLNTMFLLNPSVSPDSAKDDNKNKDGHGHVLFLDQVVKVDTKTNEKRDKAAAASEQLRIMRIDSFPSDGPHKANSDFAENRWWSRWPTRIKLFVERALHGGPVVLTANEDRSQEQAARLSFIQAQTSADVQRQQGKTVRQLSRLSRYMGGGKPD